MYMIMLMAMPHASCLAYICALMGMGSMVHRCLGVERSGGVMAAGSTVGSRASPTAPGCALSLEVLQDRVLVQAPKHREAPPPTPKEKHGWGDCSMHFRWDTHVCFNF